MERRLWIGVVVAVAAFVVIQPSSSAQQKVTNVNVVNTTQVVFDHILHFEEWSDPIDVSQFKQIRVAVSCSPALGSDVTVWLVVNSTPDEYVRLAHLEPGGANCDVGSTATIEIPGPRIRISQHAGTGRVLVYGRAN